MSNTGPESTVPSAGRADGEAGLRPAGAVGGQGRASGGPGSGGGPTAQAAGVDTTGVTVHLVDEGVDTGPVLRREPVPVEPRETLVDRIHAVEHRLLPEVVRELCAR